MDNIEFLGSVFLAGLCLLTYMAVMAIFAIVGTQAKQRSARQIMEAQARGAFADLETPKNGSRFRLLAGIALFCGLGFTCSIGVLAVQSLSYYLNLGAEFSNLNWLTIVVALVFGSISVVAGFLMNREINRRL